MKKLLILLIVIFPVIANAQTNSKEWPKELICHACGKKIIQSEYIALDYKYWHKKCFRCGYCGKVIKENVRKNDTTYYHEKCFLDHVAVICYLCGQEIVGKYYKDYWGNCFHEEHKDKDYPVCEYCGRFITATTTEGGVEYKDGRVVCTQCERKEISDLELAQSIMHDVRDTLALFGIDIDLDQVKLRLVSKDGLVKRTDKLAKDANGVTIYKTNKHGDVVDDAVNRIYLLYGMPKFTFIKVIAHEMMHIWFAEHNISRANETLLEGSCNYASYMVLEKYEPEPDAGYQLYLMKDNPDAVYGSGLRSMKEFVEKNDIAYWLQYIQENTSLP